MDVKKIFLFLTTLFTVIGSSLAVYRLVKFGGDKIEVALIPDVGNIDDDGFNQTSWQAIKEYCSKSDCKYDYFPPMKDNKESILQAIDLAVMKGAKIVICPGWKFASAVSVAQKKYPEVFFLLLDSSVEGEIKPNTVCVNYKMDFSGFLAGYATAYDYIESDFKKNKKIESVYKFGFLGGTANPGVWPFGYGFIQGVITGINDFIKENEIEIKEKPFVKIVYSYAETFFKDQRVTALVENWFNEKEPVKAVFSCGGKLYQSVIDAVNNTNDYRKINKDNFDVKDPARWIGVDVDQWSIFEDKDISKKTIITSALKKLDITIKDAFDYYFSDKWSSIGGRKHVLGLNSIFKKKRKDFVGIPISTNSLDSKVIRGFKFFDKDKLKKVTKEIIKGDKIIYDGLGKNGSDGNPSFMMDKKFIGEYLNNYDKFEIIIRSV